MDEGKIEDRERVAKLKYLVVVELVCYNRVVIELL